MGTIAMLSFRLGGTDGVSVVANRWATILRSHGWDMVSVAGDGPVDRVVPGLGLDHLTPPSTDNLKRALEDADVVIVENLLTIPMNLPASLVAAEVLRGRPALIHHHDPPWQRRRFQEITALPVDDPEWRHVTINQLTEKQFADRGLRATTIYNPFDSDETPSDGRAERARIFSSLGSDSRNTILVSHPVRAIERKNVPEALAICASIQLDLGRPVVYWLPGPAEDGYAPQLVKLERTTPVPISRLAPTSMVELYGASDLVVFPSTWEGFGNVPVEASIHRKPVVVGRYPVADELLRLGFRWLHNEDRARISTILRNPAAYDEDAAHNHAVVREFLSMKVVGDQVKTLFEEAGWRP
ncbi:MAG: glycosyltransferase family 4 protein [Acidimicrobiales bacterium]|nr:glycosyltransferase family 4 protein [Acidimicrobiales bacterium]